MVNPTVKKLLKLFVKKTFKKNLLIIPDDFNIYTREAGAGELNVAIEGPGESKLKLEDRPNGFLGVGYSVTKPGNL